MTRSPPLLSIVITTKDRPALLPRALSSALAAAPDAEVIVVDDGSSAGAAEAVAAACRGLGVKLIRNEAARGPSYARNRGLAAASGRYWAALDDDDEWLPDKWAKQQACLSEYGFERDLVVVGGFRALRPDGTEEQVMPGVAGPARFEALSQLFSSVRPRVFLNTYVAPTELMRAVGGYDERMRWGEHTDVLIRLARVARFAGVNDETVRVHVPPGGQGRNWEAKIDGIELMLAKHARDFERDPAVLALYRDVLGITQLRTGDRWGAARTFARLAAAPSGGGRRGRAAAHGAVAILGGRRFWRWISDRDRRPSRNARSQVR